MSSKNKFKIEIVEVTPLVQNCSILTNETTNESIIFDPGGDIHKIASVLGESIAKSIFLTHSHIDHAGGVEELSSSFGNSLKIYGHKNEKVMREGLSVQAEMMGLDTTKIGNCPEPTDYLEGGEVIEVLGLTLKVIFTPGHSPGHFSYYIDFGDSPCTLSGTGVGPVKIEPKILIGGDAIFKGSIGRTDLYMGNFDQLLHSIRSKILTLDPKTVILPGHGPLTTVEIEDRTNPFLNG